MDVRDIPLDHLEPGPAREAMEKLRDIVGLMGGMAQVGTVGFSALQPGQILDPWIVADGRAVSRKTYSTLFKLIGESFGAGDGATTFNVPDMRGMSLSGADPSVGYGSSGGQTVIIETTGTPSDTVVSEITFGQSPAVGTRVEYSRGDHSHGTPDDPSWGTTVPIGTWFAGEYAAGGPLLSGYGYVDLGNGHTPMMAFPIVFGKEHTYSEMSVWISTAGTSASTLRLGLYADDDGQPGAALARSDEISCYNSNNHHFPARFVFASPVTLHGRYWAVIHLSDIESTHPFLGYLYTLDVESTFAGGGFLYDWTSGSAAHKVKPYSMRVRDVAYTALPDPWGTVTAADVTLFWEYIADDGAGGNFRPAFFFKRSA
ncbi:MAG: tail fiber protein [bacterium]